MLPSRDTPLKLEDADLVNRESAAWYMSENAKLRLSAMCYFESEIDAEEALQEAWTSTIKNFWAKPSLWQGKPDPHHEATLYAYGVLRNLRVQAWRDTKRRRETSLGDWEPAALANCYYRELSDEDVKRCLSKLPEEMRQVVILRMRTEMTAKEIAKALNLETVWKPSDVLRSALRRLGECLGEKRAAKEH